MGYDDRVWHDGAGRRISRDVPKEPFRQRQPSPLGMEIYRRREAKGMTRERLEEEAGLKPNHINVIENGERKRIDPEILARIARALDCTIEDLLEPIEIPESLRRFQATEAAEGATDAEIYEIASALRLFQYSHSVRTYVKLLELIREKPKT